MKKEFNQFGKWFVETYEDKEEERFKREREFNKLDNRYFSFGKTNNY